MLNIFDIDNTVIKKTTAWYFICEALEKKAISLSQIRKLPFEWLKYKSGKPNTDFIEEAVKYMAGMEKQMLEKLAESCFIKRMKPNIYAGAIHLIKEIQERGERIIFATSSLDILIQPIKSFFGIKESLASALEFSQGKATGRISGSSLFGEKKKAAVKEWLAAQKIDPAEVIFYSDSYTDIPLLEYCGCPIVVNPDRFLKKHAIKCGWQIINLK